MDVDVIDGFVFRSARNPFSMPVTSPLSPFQATPRANRLKLFKFKSSLGDKYEALPFDNTRYKKGKGVLIARLLDGD